MSDKNLELFFNQVIAKEKKVTRRVGSYLSLKTFLSKEFLTSKEVDTYLTHIKLEA
jgi:hypothetical protein